MSELEVMEEGVSVVAKGFFNPAILTPDFLYRHDLVGPVEMDHQQVEVITPKVTAFSTGWLSVRVTLDSMQFSTVDPGEYERVRDVATGVLRVLSETPVGALGINRDVHVAIESAAEWHAIGDVLVPKEPWDGLLEATGMRTCVVWGTRNDGYAGRVQVKVEPSFRFPRSVYVGVNDHFLLAEVEGSQVPVGGRDEAWHLDEDLDIEPSSDKISLLLEILNKHWETSMSRADQYVRRIASLGRPT